MYQFYSFWFGPIGSRIHDLVAHSSRVRLTITPPMQLREKKKTFKEFLKNLYDIYAFSILFNKNYPDSIIDLMF